MAKSKKKTEDIIEQIAEQIQSPDMVDDVELVDQEEALSEDDVDTDDLAIGTIIESEEADVDSEAEVTEEEGYVPEEGVAKESIYEEPVVEEELVMTVEDVRLVEAILFATPNALTVGQMAERFPAHRVSLIPDVLEHLREQYTSRGVNLVQRDNRWALRTAADLGDHLRLEKEQPKKFTRAAMETMAIVAYHQPVTRAEIENIRGVATSPGALDALMEAGWIKPGKRREVPGRPVTWLSTQAFLDHFGLEKLEDLPGMEELKAAGLLDKRPAIEAMPTPDLFDGSNVKDEDDHHTVTDEDLIGDSGVDEDEVAVVVEAAPTEADVVETVEDAEVLETVALGDDDDDNLDDEQEDEDLDDDEELDDEESDDEESDGEDEDDLDDEDYDEDDSDEEDDEDLDDEDGDDEDSDDEDEDDLDDEDGDEEEDEDNK